MAINTKNFSRRALRHEEHGVVIRKFFFSVVSVSSVRNLFFVLFFLISCILPLIAQDENINLESEPEEDAAFFIDRSEENIRFIQRLTWEPADFTLRYEVVIERMGSTGYTECERVTVREPSAEVSLTAGQYRYKIDVYDLLNELSFESEWLNFEIKRAVQPRVSSFFPGAFYLDEDNEWIITLRGQNLIPESEIWLVPYTQGTRSSLRIVPNRKICEGTSARLEFSGASLIPGEYLIYVRNPGGLDNTTAETFSITNKKAFDLNLSLGYAPVIPVQGHLFNDYTLDAPFPDGFYPLGALLKINFIPFKFLWGSLGAEASVSYTYLEHEKEFYSANASFLNYHLSFLYQKYFLNRMFAFNADAGIGFTSLLDFHYKYPLGPPADSVNAHYTSFKAGLSVMFIIKNPFYIHAGTDFIQLLSAGEDVPLPGFFRPFISAGIKL